VPVNTVDPDLPLGGVRRLDEIVDGALGRAMQSTL
jgi:hypothetical protein